MITRCNWANSSDSMQRYHDEEWGVPLHDDQELFEFLILETFQAGLSWAIILNKRDGFRQAFANFNVSEVAMFNQDDIARLKEDTGIVRNRLKIAAAISNAQAFITIQSEFGSFDSYIWGLVDQVPIQNSWQTDAEIPAFTDTSDFISKDLRSRGFKFVGSTVVYAHMQATGMVNDHIQSCFRYKQITG